MPETQGGFRENNMNVLQHVVERETAKPTHVRGVFWHSHKNNETMKRTGDNTEMVGKVEEIYEETENVVTVREKLTESFRTTEGVTQGVN